VQTLLVAGTAVVGLAIGAALDPLGQRLADRSRAEDEARRAERQAEEAEGIDVAVVDGPGDQSTNRAPAASTVPRDRPPESVRHLLPAGRSAVRTVDSALLTGILFGAAAIHFGRDMVLAPFCVFFAALVVVSITDLTHRLVPRRVVYAGAAVTVPLLVVTSAVDHRWHSLVGAAVAGSVAFAVFFAVWWFVPRGMGFGDVRLAGFIGVTVGYLSVLHAYVAFLAGFVVGLLFGLVVMATSSAGRRTRIPFAPSLAAGAVFAVLWGGPVAHSLFHAGS
jgi:leader peptidase (prepilin peptidase)/N-methyltransferase